MTLAPGQVCDSARGVSCGIPAAVEALGKGGMVVVADGFDASDHGDLVIGAEHVDPEAINFMAREARGLVCLCLTPERCEELGLDPMDSRGAGPDGPFFMESIEARTGVTTGISAHDRARTVSVAIDPRSSAADISRPGHVVPLQSRPGGVLERSGKTEAAVDLARLAGLAPAAVLCGVLGEDGRMAELAELVDLCTRHQLGIVSVGDVVDHRRASERLLRRKGDFALTPLGQFRALYYEEEITERRHMALTLGNLSGPEPVPVHIHRSGSPADPAALSDGGTGPLGDAMREIEAAGRGAIAYLEIGEESGPDGGSGDDILLRPVDEAIGQMIFDDLGLRNTRPASNLQS